MLLTYRQYNRLLNNLPRGAMLNVGAKPDNGSIFAIDWLPEMDYFINGVHEIVKIHLVDKPVTKDGRVLYEVVLSLYHRDLGVTYDFDLAWMDDPKIHDIFGPSAIKANKIERNTDKALTKNMGIGWGVTAGGMVATLMGIAFAKNKQAKKALAALPQVVSISEENQIKHVV